MSPGGGKRTSANAPSAPSSTIQSGKAEGTNARVVRISFTRARYGSNDDTRRLAALNCSIPAITSARKPASVRGCSGVPGDRSRPRTAAPPPSDRDRAQRRMASNAAGSRGKSSSGATSNAARASGASGAPAVRAATPSRSPVPGVTKSASGCVASPIPVHSERRPVQVAPRYRRCAGSVARTTERRSCRRAASRGRRRASPERALLFRVQKRVRPGTPRSRRLRGLARAVPRLRLRHSPRARKRC